LSFKLNVFTGNLDITGAPITNFITNDADDIMNGDLLINGKLTVDNDADQIVLTVQGHSTQTSSILTLEQSDGTDVLTVDNDGNVVIGAGVVGDSKLRLFSGTSLKHHFYWDESVGASIISGNTSDDTTSLISFLPTETVFNDSSGTINTRFEGDNFTDLFFVDAVNGRVGVKTVNPTSSFHVAGNITADQGFFEDSDFPVLRADRTTGSTNDIGSSLDLKRTTTGDMVDGFGTSFNFSIEDSAGVRNNILRMSGIRDGADIQGKFLVETKDSGGSLQPGFSIDSSQAVLINQSLELDGDFNHDGTNVGLFGTTPVNQASAMTTQDTSLTHTAPGVADFAIQDLIDSGVGSAFGFATKDEGNTVLQVVLNLQTRVAELEAGLDAATGLGVFA